MRSGAISLQLARPGKDLLLGDRALGLAAPEKRDRPAGLRGHSVLEADQEREVHDEPQQPRHGSPDAHGTESGGARP